MRIAAPHKRALDIPARRLFAPNLYDNIVSAAAGRLSTPPPNPVTIFATPATFSSLSRFTYCSVPIMFTEKRRGGPLNIVSVGSKTRGRFVEISLRNEERFVLSPLDVDGFVTALREAMQATGQ